MDNKFKGLLLFVIILGSISAIPVFAASSSTNNANSTNMTSSSASSNSMNTTKSSTNSTSTGTVHSTPTPSNQQGPYRLLNSTQNPTAVTPLSGALAVTVQTDKPSYNDGDKVTISGMTRDYMGDTPLTLELRSPVGNLIQTEQITVGTDKTFSVTLSATGVLWKEPGTYSVYVQYGSKDRSAQTTFQFSGSQVSSGPGTIPVDGTSYSITYTITNGKVLDIKADPPSKSLIVTIQTTGDGLLTITMPRTVIDAKKSDGTTDDQFVVVNDGVQNSQVNETLTTSTDRTLAIPFKNGASQIDIIGTFVIPEFGPIAALVLTVAIVSIIAISKKTGLRFPTRY
ncbi:MAG: PEFG-CTERM sorting domain-containing protein [Thaumarchaeota archaeon]|nr:PEFG-CTERM sorting domain-containing protein [Nitrososphaerota archaeon]